MQRLPSCKEQVSQAAASIHGWDGAMLLAACFDPGWRAQPCYRGRPLPIFSLQTVLLNLLKALQGVNGVHAGSSLWCNVLLCDEAWH